MSIVLYRSIRGHDYIQWEKFQDLNLLVSMYYCLFRNTENFVNFEKSGQKSTDHVSKGQGQNVRVWDDK